MKQLFIKYSGDQVIKIHEVLYFTWEASSTIKHKRSEKNESKKNNLKAVNIVIYKLGI